MIRREVKAMIQDDDMTKAFIADLIIKESEEEEQMEDGQENEEEQEEQ